MTAQNKTVIMQESGSESIQAPQFGLLIDFSQLEVGKSKEYRCSLAFQIPPGSTLYLQNKGSGGAEVSNWTGPDHHQDSGSISMSFHVKRTSTDYTPDPLAIYAININDPDRNNVYKEFTLDLNYASFPV